MKQRLIDLNQIEYFTLVDKDGVPRYKVEIGEGDIGIEEVEAIPVEWLKMLQAKYLEANCNMSACVVNEIISLWRKENE